MQPSRSKVMHVIWSLDLGGAEQVVLNLVRKLDRGRFEPIVCCLNEKGRYAEQVEREGIRVMALHKRPKFDPLLVPRLVRLIKREGVDLIHTHLFTGNLWGRIAAKIAGVPVISTEHGMDTWRGRFELTLDRWLTKTNRRVIFVSEGVKRFYSERNPSLNGKGRVLHNGIEVENFGLHSSKNNVLAELGIAHGRKVIGIVGRLVPEKSHEDFLEAIRLLYKEGREVTGLIVGEGEREAFLRGKVREMGIEKDVVFTGFRQDLDRLYSAMDVFVICSIREGFPLTILEAMAAGVPIVATRVGGILESIQDREEGLLVPAGHPEGLANSIASVLDDSQLRERLIKNARDLVRNRFSAEKMVKDHEALYEEVLAS